MYEDDLYDYAAHEVYSDQINALDRAVENQKTLDESKEFIEEIVKQLYSHDVLDKDIVHHCVVSICDYFEISLPEGKLNIQRMRRQDPILSDWVEFNNKYLSQTPQGAKVI